MALGIGDPAIPPLSTALLAARASVIPGFPDAISAADFSSGRTSDLDTESEGIVSEAVADILQFMPDLDTVYAIDPPDSTAILRHVESSADHRASLHSRAHHSLMRAQAGHRLRHHHLLQQRHVPPVYEVRGPGDYVHVTTRNPQGLRPKI